MKILPFAAFIFFCAAFVTCGGANLGHASSLAMTSLPVLFLGISAFAIIRLWYEAWWRWLLGSVGYWILGIVGYLFFSGTFMFIDQRTPGIGKVGYALYGTAIFALVFRKVRNNFLSAEAKADLRTKEDSDK